MGRPRLKRFKTKKVRNFKFPFKLLILFGIVFLAVFYFLARTRYWDGKNKLSVVVGGENSIEVTTFDPTLGQITTISIPGSTQVEVARNLGTWPIGSVWKLGIQEKLEGKLLQETIIKNFGFPVTTWSAEEAQNLSKGNLAQLPSVFSLYKTNLSMGDRFRIFLFSLKVSDANKNFIDLSKTQLLRKIKLVDGGAGYGVTTSTPTEFIGLFSNDEISRGLFTVSLVDSSTESELTENLKTVIEYLGAKVVSKSSSNASQDLDCEIVSKNQKFGRLVSQIFDCKFLNEVPEGNFDLEFNFGNKFAKRF